VRDKVKRFFKKNVSSAKRKTEMKLANDHKTLLNIVTEALFRNEYLRKPFSEGVRILHNNRATSRPYFNSVYLLTKWKESQVYDSCKSLKYIFRL
jgi:hypothetical protein